MATVVSEYLEVFLAFAAVIGVLYGALRRGQKALENKITEVAIQIQPKNGGTGWTDLHKKVDCLVENQAQIKSDVETLRSAVVTLENNAEGIE